MGHPAIGASVGVVWLGLVFAAPATLAALVSLYRNPMTPLRTIKTRCARWTMAIWVPLVVAGFMVLAEGGDRDLILRADGTYSVAPFSADDRFSEIALLGVIAVATTLVSALAGRAIGSAIYRFRPPSPFQIPDSHT